MALTLFHTKCKNIPSRAVHLESDTMLDSTVLGDLSVTLSSRLAQQEPEEALSLDLVAHAQKGSLIFMLPCPHRNLDARQAKVLATQTFSSSHNLIQKSSIWKSFREIYWKVSYYVWMWTFKHVWKVINLLLMNKPVSNAWLLNGVLQLWRLQLVGSITNKNLEAVQN